MPPLSKKLKLLNKESSNKTVAEELETFQDEIRMIKGMTDDTPKEDQDYESRFLEDPLVENLPAQQNDEVMRKYIREQVRSSERRISNRLDRLEQKLNRLLERQIVQLPDGDELIEEEHLVEWTEPELEQKSESADLDFNIFPINDEGTFDFFFEKLRDENYRNALITDRWQLTRSVSTKSFNISVKDFLRMHFELPVVVKYSVSGFGAHGIRKKKLDFNSLSLYVFECFNKSMGDFFSYQEVSKAIVQFWGRAPDTLNKANDRASKRESMS